MPLVRDEQGPFLEPSQVPALRADLIDVSSVFNPGAVRVKDRDLLLLRVQTRGRTTLLMPAEASDLGVEFLGLPLDLTALRPRAAHVYDPRLTQIGDTTFAICAADTDDGCALVTLATDDFEHWEIVAVDTSEDHRNGVLFPEKIGGRFVRLTRPNHLAVEGGPRTGSTIRCSTSEDLVVWEDAGEVMHGRPRLWDEIIGSGPPPVKTRDGWLHVYHGVATHFGAANIYQAGVVLLDSDEPWQVVARGAFNILEPRRIWEQTGQVPNVVFPSGLTVDLDPDGIAAGETAVTVYYGAADTVVGRAATTIADLIDEAHFAG